MNKAFLVETLNEITEKHFKATCVAAMSDSEELKGLLGVPCGDDFYLYEGRDKALVYVRNWSRMLSLHIVSESGTWLVSSHIEGRGVDGILEEAWRQFLVAKPYIKTYPEKAFKPLELSKGSSARWMQWTEEYMDFIRDHINVYNTYRRKVTKEFEEGKYE